MHPNQIFRQTEEAKNIAFVRKRAFGVLTVNGDPVPLLSHIPFQLSKDGKRLEAHLVKSNPIARALSKPMNAVMVVSGGDGYISPDWYKEDDFVPTWNYVAVHLHGTLKLDPQEKLRGVLERVSHAMEERLLPKPIWKMDKVTPDKLDRMMRSIVPISMDVAKIDGTWKLSQNKGNDAFLAAGDALGTSGFGLGFDKISKLMTELNKH